MSDTVEVDVIKSKVFHDGKSMIVLNAGQKDVPVEKRFLKGLVDEGHIKPFGKSTKDADYKEPEVTGYAAMTTKVLEKLATERSVMPEAGTGENDAVTKDDIVAALGQADADSAPA